MILFFLPRISSASARSESFTFSSFFMLFLSARMSSNAFVYLALAKMSSNFCLSTLSSASGQSLSSWWTKITDSSTACDTPISSGTILFRSAHLNERFDLRPASSKVCSAASNALYSFLSRFCVSEKLRMQITGLPVADVNLSFTCAFTSVVQCVAGSLTNACPLRQFGGSEPVHAILRHSMIVVLPLPFLPTISVSG